MGKWVHRLSEIDPERRVAVCANCGPVAIKRRRSRSNGWGCWVSVGRWASREADYTYMIHKKDSCEQCGFVPAHTCQLDVDHIDGDPMNSVPENLQTLCANCHRLKTHLNKDNVQKD